MQTLMLTILVCAFLIGIWRLVIDGILRSTWNYRCCPLLRELCILLTEDDSSPGPMAYRRLSLMSQLFCIFAT